MMYAIMVVAGIGMIIGLQKEKGGAAWGRPMAIVCIIIAVGAAVFQMMGGGGKGGAQGGIEEAYRNVKGEKLGVYLAGKFAGKKALVLLPPEMPMMGGEQPAEPAYKAVLEGLEKGLGGKVQIVGKIEPKMPEDVKAKLQSAMGAGGAPEDMAMMPEGQMWFDVPALDKELASYKGKYDMLICLTSLPGVDMMMPMGGGKKPIPIGKLSIMKDDKVKLVLAEGSINKFGRAIQSQKVVAAVTYKQNIDEKAYEEMPPKELDAAFDMRFVLITPETLSQYASYFQR
jgi:hypothetical protein